MTRKAPTYLRLHVEDAPPAPCPRLDESTSLHSVCDAFQAATGWELQYGTNPKMAARCVWSRRMEDAADPPGLLGLMPPEKRRKGEAPTACDFESTQRLAGALGDLLQELHSTRHALWQREAELAAGVPVLAQGDEETHLAARLEAVLKAGAQAIGCQAAAAYLLDDATRELKLRSSWGLPRSRFLAPPRPLRGAAADLEALVGHAVVLEDTRRTSPWKVPEEFRSAMCVPIASPTVPFGTLWAFCDHPRPFSKADSDLLEIVAGRVAADLERSILLQQNLGARRYRRQLTAAAQWQQNRLPRIKPLVAGWDLAGWTAQSDGLGGNFHDWCVLPDGNLAMAVADAQGQLLEAGLTASAVHAAFKAHSGYRHTAEEMVTRLNETLWTASAGDQFASFFYGLIQPETGRLEHVSAGAVYSAIVGPTVGVRAAEDHPPLGAQPDSIYLARRDTLQRGDLLIVYNEGVRKALRGGREGGFWEWLLAHREESADSLVAEAQTFLDEKTRHRADDQTILLVRRCAPI